MSIEMETAAQVYAPAVAPPLVRVKPTTGEELYAMGDIGRTELVEGEVIHLMPTGFRHAIVEGRIARLLGDFLGTHDVGHVLTGEAGIYTHRNPDTVRGMDVAYISRERLAQSQSHSYLDVAPELIVEVLSPEDKWLDVNDKLAEHFGIGVQMVWVINPGHAQVYVYHSMTDVTILGVEDVLSGGDVLPGFSVPVAEIFTA